MSDKSREQRIRHKKGNLQRRVSFRITPDQASELDKMIQKGMNPSFEFRSLFDKMMHTRGRRF